MNKELINRDQEEMDVDIPISKIKTINSPVIQCWSSGEFIKSWKTVSDAAEYYKIQPELILKCMTTYTGTLKGYTWKKIYDDKFIPGEIWKKHNVYHDDLEISNHGRVKTARGVQYGSWYKNHNNQCITIFNKNDRKPKTLSIGKMVCELFISKRLPDDKYVIHVDGDRTNNKITNLKWSPFKKENTDKKPKIISFEKFLKKTGNEIKIKKRTKNFNTKLKKTVTFNDVELALPITFNESVKQITFNDNESISTVNTEMEDFVKSISIINLFDGQEIMKINVKSYSVGEGSRDAVESAIII